MDAKTTEKPVKPSFVPERAAMDRRWNALRSERSTWMTSWRDIYAHMRPAAFREYRSDANKGDRKHEKVINFTPLEAARTLASGMMAGITSPSRPWFRLTLSDPQLAEEPEVKWWLSEVERIIRTTLARSNIYKCLHLVYADLGPGGTAVMLVEEDAQDDVRGFVFTCGTYALAASPRGDVDTVFREVSLTVSQVVRLFGLEKTSTNVQRMFRDGQLDDRIDILHAIVPNDTFRAGKVGPQGKQWLSLWWESKSGVDAGYLRVSGFDTFPCCIPRWEVTGEDVYGRGPGFAALGDCRQLQLLEKRSAQAVDKHINPPMSAPSSASSSPVSLVPGAVNFVDALGAGQVLRPALQADPRAIDTIREEKRELERRIRKAFFADLWLLLSESDVQMTAREVQERREEKLLQLGTVLEALQDELLDPLIDRVYSILQRRGRLPPPPKVLQGRDFDVEYVSIMAQAQKMLGKVGLESLATFTGNLAQVKPDVLDKVDFDQLVDEYADSLGVPPATVRTDDDVEALRAKRAKEQQQAQALAQAQQGAAAAKDLAASDTEKSNALTELLKGVGAR